MQIVDRIIEKYGGAAALARRIGVSDQCVHYWKKTQKIPKWHVVAIEEVTGIDRREIRPDVFLKSDSMDQPE